MMAFFTIEVVKCLLFLTILVTLKLIKLFENISILPLIDSEEN